MEKLLYNLSIRSYQGLVRVLAPFNPKARLWMEGRKDILKRLEAKIGEHKGKLAWFHCASLGEFEQGRPLIEKFRSEFPEYKILLTFFSPSGYEIRKNYNQADYIFYLPLDNSSNAKMFLTIVKPSIVFFVKYEFWYHYISEIRKNNIPLLSVSAIFRKEQLFFKSYGKFYAQILKDFNHIFVQNEESARLLKSIDFDDFTITGDTRFDRVKQITSSAVAIPLVEKFKNGYPILVAGSTWKEDMQILIPFINSFKGKLKFIIAPHEIHETEIDSFINQIDKKSLKMSEASDDSISSADVLFINNIGMLSSLYKYGDYAFIGGGFGKGIHNILEAVVNGVPVFFGINYKKFKEACDLVQLGTSFSVRDFDEFDKTFGLLYSDDIKRGKIEQLNKKYIEENSGATQKIIDFCKRILS